MVKLSSDADAAFPRTVFRIDPLREATRISAERVARPDDPPLPSPYSVEVGRRLLLAELTYPEWVLRRVEKVTIEGDRCVSRRISIEFRVPDHAPVLCDGDKEHWLVPLSVMRRRTLVNLDLRDEEGRSIPLLGLRFAQSLDESILLAAAQHSLRCREVGEEVVDLIREAVAGNAQTVRRAEAKLDSSALGEPTGAFAEARSMLEKNFSLFVLLPVTGPRHRLIRISFTEPSPWRHQRPELTVDRETGTATYGVGRTRMVTWQGLASATGLRPTRLRFQVPSAAHAASYHFEMEAPPGTSIVQGSLLAGAPHEERQHSVDEASGYQPVLGLHAVEVPVGSLCRAQVDLRIPTRGWLSTVMVACLAATAALWAVWRHLTVRHAGGAGWDAEELQAIAVLLLGITGAAAVYVAHHAETGVAARMATGLRMLAAVVIGAPAVVGIYITMRAEADHDAFWRAPVLVVALAVCVGLTSLLLGIYARTTISQVRARHPSPWTITGGLPDPAVVARSEVRDYLELARRLGFDSAAIGIESAEGWRERYVVASGRRQRLVEELRDPTWPTLAVDPRLLLDGHPMSAYS